MAEFHSIIKPAVNFALPPRCPICGIIIEQDHHLCLDCWQNLDFINEPWCQSCGVPFSFERPKEVACTSCLANPPKHDGVRAAVAYDSESSKIPMGLKYSAKLGLAKLVANHLVKFARDLPEDSILVPVPLYRWRLWSRGFNQATLIANALSERSGFPVNNNILKRRYSTPPLRSMNAKQRKKIVGNAFMYSESEAATIAGKTIILVDDVYTTGATSNSCSKILKLAGALSVLVFCWARVIGDMDKL